LLKRLFLAIMVSQVSSLPVTWAYVDPGTTGLLFSSFGYIIGAIIAFIGAILIPFRIILRKISDRSKIGNDLNRDHSSSSRPWEKS